MRPLFPLVWGYLQPTWDVPLSSAQAAGSSLASPAGSHLRGGQQRPRASAGVCRRAAEDGERRGGFGLAGRWVSPSPPPAGPALQQRWGGATWDLALLCPPRGAGGIPPEMGLGTRRGLLCQAEAGPTGIGNNCKGEKWPRKCGSRFYLVGALLAERPGHAGKGRAASRNDVQKPACDVGVVYSSVRLPGGPEHPWGGKLAQSGVCHSLRAGRRDGQMPAACLPLFGERRARSLALSPRRSLCPPSLSIPSVKVAGAPGRASRCHRDLRARTWAGGQ